MKIRTTIFLLFLISILNAQNDSTTYHRYYEFGVGPKYDLQNSAINGMSIFKAVQDGVKFKLKPKLPPKVGNVLEGIWSVGFTYVAMLWSHEFGHSLRAKQVGGKFNIHNIALPIPYTTLDLPTDVSFQNTALSVTAGFEVNYTAARQLQMDFFEYNGAYNDEMVFAAVHRIMYPIYSSLVVPRDPKEKDTWIDTAGDPVHIAKPVWESDPNHQVFLADSTVSEGLGEYYNRSSIFAMVLNLTDPSFYKQIAAMFGSITDGKRPWYIIGDEHKGWTFGTMFNASPLGYEIHFNNYIKWNDKLFILHLKKGNPYKNNAIAFTSPNLYQNGKLKIGGSIEIWDQYIYGNGAAVYSDLHYKFNDRFGLHLQAGYKSKGYTLGRPVNSGVIGFLGMRYYPKLNSDH